jgi:alpha-maltose-1-phosphate synthase
MTREFPPEVYGGAGVHVDFLVRQLRSLLDVQVFCFGAPRPTAQAFAVPAELADANFSLQALGVDLQMAASAGGVDLVHSHTWYTNLAGHLAGLLYQVPHVLTAHSLEPRRPWKLEQLGGGYQVSSWMEAAAYAGAAAVIAVSDGMRSDVLACYPFLDPERVHVVRNGIDTVLYQPDPRTDALARVGVDPGRPYVLFVGRITRQKGVGHLLAAAHALDPDVQLVLCASSPDTEQIGVETADAVAALRAHRSGVRWVEQMLPREDLVQLLTHAAVFVCPSVYEPLGIVNLEAMACGTAVVASDVGGIPEVVVDQVTGLLAHYDEADPRGFEADLARLVGELVSDPARAEAMGLAGRRRAEQEFSWARIAEQTVGVYTAALAGQPRR